MIDWWSNKNNRNLDYTIILFLKQIGVLTSLQYIYLLAVFFELCNSSYLVINTLKLNVISEWSALGHSNDINGIV